MSPAEMRLRVLLLKILHRLLLGLSPLAASAVVFCYFAILHDLFLFSSFEFNIWMLILLAPPVLFEIWFTRIFEAERRGFNPIVCLGLAGRICFILCCYYVCVWFTLLFNNTPDAFLGLFRKWPNAVLFFWTASPNLAAILAILVVAAYLFLTVRHRLFRLQTTVILPAVATLLLAHLLYLNPTSPLRLETHQRPSYIQKIFPGEKFPGSGHVFEPPLFARELYVDPSDRFAVLTFGASYGEEIEDQPNLVWLDIENQTFGYHIMDQTRNFYSECPQSVYVAPWHGTKFYSLDPRSHELTEYSLPKRVGPFLTSEIMYTYHACDISTVYLINNRNPVLFAWDTRSESVRRVLPLAELGLLHYGDSLPALGRNRPRKKLYVLAVGKNHLIELDEDTLEPTRAIRLPADPFDIQASSDGRYIYSAAFLEGTVWKVDASSLQVQAAFSAPLHSRRIGLSPDDRLLFAAGYLSGEVAVINTQNGSCLLDFYVTPKLEGMCVTGQYLYLLGSEGMFRVALATLMEEIGR
jgi:hypothetical protein